jgi:signal peptidase I
MFEFRKNKYFRFGVAAVIYLAFVIWLGNYWYLAGLGIIYDLYITRKVNWTFWKKRDQKNSTFIEWLDALIFAVVAVTLINIYLFQNYKIPTPSMESTMLVGDHLYVSKMAYGPRVPNTPLAFPFTQNRLPVVNKESYLNWIELPYKRLAGFGKVKRNDIVVFNFPAGDTVVVEQSARSYYSIVREYAIGAKSQDLYLKKSLKTWESYMEQGRKLVRGSRNLHIVERPVDRRDNYIKRCVAIPGDSLEVRDGDVYVNGQKQPDFAGIQYEYLVQTNGQPLNPRVMEKYGISEEYLGIQNNPNYYIPLNKETAERLKKELPNIAKVERQIYSSPDYQTFPNSQKFSWAADRFGPVWIPKKGATVSLNLDNLPFFERIISAYEGNTLNVDKDGKIYINGKEAKEYTFGMDYYFMMGDNRHRSADSRFWGYVPEDHIIGKPKFIWLSTDKDRSFPQSIRWNRFFKLVDAAE